MRDGMFCLFTVGYSKPVNVKREVKKKKKQKQKNNKKNKQFITI